MILTIEVTPNMSYVDFREIAVGEFVKYAIQRASGNLTNAAKIAHTHRTHFSGLVAHYRLKEFAQALRTVKRDLRNTINGRDAPSALAR